jgi:two-component system CheB/CheR fusion protein
VNASESTPEFEALLQYLQRTRSFDFTDYKRASLMRRMSKRMDMVGISTYPDYVDYLEVHPEEFAQLFNTILINVTEFFRDLPAWQYLAKEILPRQLKSSNSVFRVWCAGCASGEEAYTIAILLHEALGTSQFLNWVKIYATDLDEHALTQARLATFTPQAMEGLPEEYRKTYFQTTNGVYTFRNDLRRAIIFGRHDLLQDAPISWLDLLICRNTLMYFNIEAQSRILRRFHFALNAGGTLFLGKAETLLAHASIFTPIELRYRMFTKLSQPNSREAVFELAPNAVNGNESPVLRSNQLRELAFENSSTALITLSAAGILEQANEHARSLLGLSLKDIGLPFQNLEVSYRPVELRSRVDQAYTERRTVFIADVERPLQDGSNQYLDVYVTPLCDADDRTVGATIAFHDVTRRHELQSEVQRSKQELETAYEELQSSNEELETANEELQSTIEELQTTNEELQSTNEELETMNEELHSTNEEIETSNEELHHRTDELNDISAFLESILTALRVGIVALDKNFTVGAWNYASEDMWGLRADEVQTQPFFSLDIGLPVDQLGTLIRSTLSGDGGAPSVITVDARNRRGKAIRCRVTASPRRGSGGERRGVILMMENLENER